MVEDGHVGNSYSVGPSAYYPEEITTKHSNDGRHRSSSISNNHHRRGDSVAVLVDRDKPTIMAPSSTTAPASATIGAQSAVGNHVAATSPLGNHLPPATSPIGAASAPLESNGSSHAAAVASRLNPSAGHRRPDHRLYPSHEEHRRSPNPHHNHYDDVTKDVERGTLGGGHALPSAPAADVADGGAGANLTRGELHKTALAFVILIFNFLLTTTSLAIIHDKVPGHGPLPDAVLDMFEARSWALIVSEVLIILTTGTMLVIVVTHPHRFIIMRRLFLMLSLLYFMRSVTMFVTVLPVSSRTYYCSPKSAHPDAPTIVRRSLTLFFGMGLTLNGKHTYCGDYIYSGHTTILVMSYLMISEYSPQLRQLRWLRWATWAMSLTGVLMVLLSHSHYTVDVVIGYFVTTRLFWMYHTCANNAALKRRSRYNYLAREWWFGLFVYFEGNVNGPLQPPYRYR